jgi:hypothetical protein
LLRAQYAGPEGRVGFKLVLRLEADDRYDLSAVDAAGRPLWRLLARASEGIFEDVAAERFCRLHTAAPLPGGLGFELPLSAVPKLLLARLPAPAASIAATGDSGNGTRERRDGTQRWTWSLEAGELRQWTLWRDGQPAVWWSRQGSASLLSVRERSTQVRWEIALSEPMERPLGDLKPSDGFEEGACARDVS